MMPPGHQLHRSEPERGQALLGIVAAMVVLALLVVVALHSLGSGPSDPAHGRRATSAGTALGVIRQAKVEALAATAYSVLDQATTLALPTGLGPGAIDPSSAGSTFLQVAAGDVRGKTTAATLHPRGHDRYEMSSSGAVVCITAPVTETGEGSVVNGPCD